jgi:Flp pilus assembly protein TadD
MGQGKRGKDGTRSRDRGQATAAARSAAKRPTRPSRAIESAAAVDAAAAGAATQPGGAVWTRFWFQALVLAALACVLYANTLGHGYTFDDGIVIRQNTHVQQGLAGIPNILSRDAFDAYFRQMNVNDQQLSGGRYRPLSLVTFALEQAVVGDSPRLRHAINVLLYALTAVLLLCLLRSYLLRDATWAFVATLLFVVHPIHVEAVANIKGRDEILSLLFIVLTLAFALRHDQRPRLRDFALGLVCYFLALLAKEYGLALIVLLPLAFFIVGRRGVFDALLRAAPYFAIAAIYIGIRLAVIGFHTVTPTDVLTNPYLYATPAEAWATKLAMLLRYLGLLFWPFPLSSDYSYKHVQYLDFTSPWPWIAIAVHVVLVAWGAWLTFRRDVRGFAVFFYLGMLALVSNVVVDIGAFMGERLVYHASLGFVLIIAWALVAIARRDDAANARARRVARGGIAALVAGITLAAGAWTIERNFDWKDDYTLFTHDVRVAPDSALLNANAGMQSLEAANDPANAARRDELLLAAVRYTERAIEIHPKLVAAHVNLGTAMFNLGRLDDAEREWLIAKGLRSNDPMVQRNLKALAEVYYRKGLDDGSEKRYPEALAWFEKALRFDASRPVIWTNLGKTYYWLKQPDKAREAFQRALQLEPGHPDAVAGLAAVGAKAP